MLSISIDREKCIKCGECVNICCNSNVIETDDDGYPVYKHIHKCISCGHCIAICPQHAISTHNTRPDQDNRIVTDEIELRDFRYDPAEVSQLISSTRSERFFLEKPVETDKIKSILDAMIRSPSAGNEQNRNYYIFTAREHIHELELDMQKANAKQIKALSNPLIRAIAMAGMKPSIYKTYEENGIILTEQDVNRCVAETLASLSNQRENFFIKDAPAVIIITSNAAKKGMHANFYKADVEIAVTHGTILATALGLSTCRLGLAEIFLGKNSALREKYGIPKTERVDEVLAIGYSDTVWKRIPKRGPAKVIWNT